LNDVQVQMFQSIQFLQLDI